LILNSQPDYTKTQRVRLRYRMVDTKDKAVRAPPALNPEQMALVQPWKDFVSLGLITAIKAEFTPGGTRIAIDISESIQDAVTRTGLAPGVAKQLIIASGLAPQKGKNKGEKKKEEPLPARTLCGKDLEKASDFARRLKAVATKLGPSTALGRIGSLKMHIDNATSFEQWWRLSKPEEKSRLVMDKKHIDSLTEEESQKLSTLIEASESPFRGPFPDNSSNESEEKAVPQKAPSKQSAPAPSGKGKEKIAKK